LVPTKTKATRTATETNEDPLLRIEALLKCVEEQADRAEKRVETLEEFIRSELLPRVGYPVPAPPEPAIGVVRRPMATTTTVSDTVRSATGCISDNHQQPLRSRQKARRLIGPRGLAIPRLDLIDRVPPPTKDVKADVSSQPRRWLTPRNIAPLPEGRISLPFSTVSVCMLLQTNMTSPL
jgi:hypothetical protein